MPAFSQTVNSLCAAVDSAAKAAPAKKFAMSKKAKFSVALPNHKPLFEQLSKLSPEDRRKVAALALAGKHGVSVKAAFAVVQRMPFCPPPTSLEDVRKGAADAAKAKLLDADWSKP
jgi:hypothetical protein